MITENELAQLKNFFGAYFNEDWDLEADTPEGIVSIFVNETPEQERIALRNAILDYMQQPATDSELWERMFSELGCYYRSPSDTPSARSWLQAIAAQLVDTAS